MKFLAWLLAPFWRRALVYGLLFGFGLSAVQMWVLPTGIHPLALAAGAVLGGLIWGPTMAWILRPRGQTRTAAEPDVPRP